MKWSRSIVLVTLIVVASVIRSAVPLDRADSTVIGRRFLFEDGVIINDRGLRVADPHCIDILERYAETRESVSWPMASEYKEDQPQRIDAIPSISGDQNWSDQFAFSGVDASVLVATFYNGDLIIGGGFTYVDGVRAPGLARYDGAEWHSLYDGDEMDGYPLCFEEYNGELVIGGRFTSIGGTPTRNLAVWDGSIIRQLGGGANDDVRTLYQWGDDLLVGGAFDSVDVWVGVNSPRIARWDGSEWHAFGPGLYTEWPGLTATEVWALQEYNGCLYMGGAFSSDVGTVLLKFDGETWSEVGSGLWSENDRYFEVYDLLVWNDQLIVAGTFDSAGGIQAENIAVWNDTSWSSPGNANGTVIELEEYQGYLAAAGYFNDVGGTAANYVALWDGTEWSAPDSTFDAFLSVRALASDQNMLYVGGHNLYTDSLSDRLLTWDGVKYGTLANSTGLGLDDHPYAMIEYDDKLLVTGQFRRSGSVISRNWAYWTGADWEAFPKPIWGSARTLEIWNGELIAAGTILDLPGVDTNHVIAAFNGSEWHKLGDGIVWDFPANVIGDLIVYDSLLLAAGKFTRQEDKGPRNLAAFDGVQWTAFYNGSGFSDSVSSLIYYNGQLHAGGEFAVVDDQYVYGIARWDGSAWYPVGTGLPAPCYDLEVYNNKLYAAGPFGLCSWDGSEWVWLASGATIWDMAVYDNHLISAGDFIGFGGWSANFLISWNGFCFGRLGSGLDYLYYFIDMFQYDGTLYLGGDFNTAGGKPSVQFASYTGDIISCDCCDFGLRGNLDNDDSGSIDVSDLVLLVDYMFQGGGPIACLEQADVNGDGQPADIADLVYLVTYMFRNGPDPASCE